MIHNKSTLVAPLEAWTLQYMKGENAAPKSWVGVEISAASVKYLWGTWCRSVAGENKPARCSPDEWLKELVAEEPGPAT